MRVALAGNPNSGKTTLFNAMTGKVEHVGNWPGVTVAKKEGNVRKNLNQSGRTIRIVDLPGAYSITPYTAEEGIASSFILDEKPDVIVNIIDATSLRRSLLFTTQLLELGVPVVIALNKSDLLAKRGIEIQTEKLAKKLGCIVVKTSSLDKKGLVELIDLVQSAAGAVQNVSFPSFGIESMTRRRSDFVDALVNRVEKRKVVSHKRTRQDMLDEIVAHKFLGLPIFAAVIYLVFSISQIYLGPLLADFFVEGIDYVYDFVAELLVNNVSPLLGALLLDGIIGGVGAVVGFLPLIMVLFFLIALLEDSGYMARVAVVMDRHLQKVGLSGKSIIPMVVGAGCSIPGIMATRTIRDQRQRRITAMLTPFMPCGAKLPVIALFTSLFFKDAAWVSTAMYFVGILIIVFGAYLVNKITNNHASKSYFIMELPEYRLPSLKRAFFSVMSRAKAFIVKATTIILVCNALVHIMQTFNWSFQVVEAGMVSTSILASIAHPFAILLIPLGFGIWQFAAAAITGFIAKENVVGTLAIVYSITNFIDVKEFSLISGANEVSSVIGITPIAALSYLIFVLFTPPCFAAIGAMNIEMESKRWFWAGIGFQFSIGYSLSFLVYQIGTLVSTGSFGEGVEAGALVVALFISIIIYLINRNYNRVHVLKEAI